VVFNASQGVPPNNMGALIFDHQLSQYLEGGDLVFNLDSNRGFTAITVVQFKGMLGLSERIFDFGNGERAQNIFIARSATSSSLFLSMVEYGVADCNAELPNAIKQNAWITVVVTYYSSTKT